MRGIAIVLVFLRHADDAVSAPASGTVVGPVAAFARAGHTGVSLFFIISAFLLSLPFLDEAMGQPPVQRGRYFARRALRILPVYYVAVAVAVLLTAQHWSAALPYMTFLNGFGVGIPMLPYSAVWWSLATEVQFYMVLPLLPLCVRWRGGGMGTLVLAACATAYAAFVGGWLHASSLPGQMALSLSALGRAPLFVLGIAAAWISRKFGARLHDACLRTGWAGSAGDVLLVLVLLALGRVLQRVAFQGFWDAEAHWPVWHVLEGASTESRIIR